MTERLTQTAHGDAPLDTAYRPDALASNLWATEADDELIGETLTIARPLSDVAAFVSHPANLEQALGTDSKVSLSNHTAGALVWRFKDGDLVLSGQLALREAPAGRGTEVTLAIATESRSALSKLIDRVKGDDPRVNYRRFLRRLKQLAETGEIAITDPGPAAPRGES
ncbi:MAG: hypothetical protein ABW136_09950 [Steroidobacteraceae bacterium]